MGISNPERLAQKTASQLNFEHGNYNCIHMNIYMRLYDENENFEGTSSHGKNSTSPPGFPFPVLLFLPAVENDITLQTFYCVDGFLRDFSKRV